MAVNQPSAIHLACMKAQSSLEKAETMSQDPFGLNHKVKAGEAQFLQWTLKGSSSPQ